VQIARFSLNLVELVTPPRLKMQLSSASIFDYIKCQSGQDDQPGKLLRSPFSCVPVPGCFMSQSEWPCHYCPQERPSFNSKPLTQGLMQAAVVGARRSQFDSECSRRMSDLFLGAFRTLKFFCNQTLNFFLNRTLNFILSDAHSLFIYRSLSLPILFILVSAL
jgi:hypothetical protein